MTTDNCRQEDSNERARLIEHLKAASATVSSWPQWKQTVLGAATQLPRKVSDVSNQAKVEKPSP